MPALPGPDGFDGGGIMPTFPQPACNPNSTAPDKSVSKFSLIGQKLCHLVLTDHDMF